MNFILHELTAYDKDIASHMVGRTQQYNRYHKAVFAKIAEAYPDLAEECFRQMQRKKNVAEMILIEFEDDD